MPTLIPALLVAMAASLSAFLGGWLAIRAVRYVGLVIAIGAGIRIGAAFVDLIPESIDYLGLSAAMIWTATGFLAFYVLEQLTNLHVGHETVDRARPRQREPPASRRGRRHRDGHPQLPRRRGACGGAGGRGRCRHRHRRRRRSSTASVTASAWCRSCWRAGRPSAVAWRWLTIVAIAPIAGVVVGTILAVPDDGARRDARRSSPGSSCTSAPPSCCPRPTGATARGW